MPVVAGDLNNRDSPCAQTVKRLVGRRQRRLTGNRRLEEKPGKNKDAGDFHGSLIDCEWITTEIGRTPISGQGALDQEGVEGPKVESRRSGICAGPKVEVEGRASAPTGQRIPAKGNALGTTPPHPCVLKERRQTKGLAFYRWMDLRVWELGGGNGALGDCHELPCSAKLSPGLHGRRDGLSIVELRAADKRSGLSSLDGPEGLGVRGWQWRAGRLPMNCPSLAPRVHAPRFDRLWPMEGRPEEALALFIVISWAGDSEIATPWGGGPRGQDGYRLASQPRISRGWFWKKLNISG